MNKKYIFRLLCAFLLNLPTLSSASEDFYVLNCISHSGHRLWATHDLVAVDNLILAKGGAEEVLYNYSTSWLYDDWQYKVEVYQVECPRGGDSGLVVSHKESGELTHYQCPADLSCFSE